MHRLFCVIRLNGKLFLFTTVSSFMLLIKVESIRYGNSTYCEPVVNFSRQGHTHVDLLEHFFPKVKSRIRNQLTKLVMRCYVG
jgi:hypothetical protein